MEKVTLQVPGVENHGCANTPIAYATLALEVTSDRVHNLADGCFRQRIRLFLTRDAGRSWPELGEKSWSGQRLLLKKFA